MMAIKTIPFDTKIDGKKQAAFTILHTKHPVYKMYPGLTPPEQAMEIPLCLMLRRWDGMTGFPGGHVEDGESLLEAAIRELYEEIGLNLSTDLAARLRPVVAHDIGKITTHAFALHLPWESIVEVSRNVFNAEHFGSETCGSSLEHLIDYEQMGKGSKGLKHVLRMPLATSVREELVHLILREKYASYDSLGKTCSSAGYSICELSEGYVVPSAFLEP